MTTIFLVQSGLKHDGVLYSKGSFIEGDAGAFYDHVQDGTLRKIENATNFAEAEQILKDEEEFKDEEPTEVEPQDTWAPSPELTDPVSTESKVADETQEIKEDGEEKEQGETEPSEEPAVITQEHLDNNPELVALGVEVGDTVDLAEDVDSL